MIISRDIYDQYIMSDNASFIMKRSSIRAMVDILKEAPPEVVVAILRDDILALFVEGSQGNLDPYECLEVVRILTVLADNSDNFVNSMIDFDGFDIIDNFDREIDEDGIIDGLLNRFCGRTS